MDLTTYEIEAQVERHHWWFRGRRKILRRVLRGLEPPLATTARVLDIGCGTGANGPVLGDDGRYAVGLDASAIPLGLGKDDDEDSYASRVCASAMHLPFAAASFDLVTALDILEHLDDDYGAAREIGRVVRPGGAVIVFVPAFEFLWGLQDEVGHHRRRYRKHRLFSVLSEAGLTVRRATYFNTLLFAPILAARLLMRLYRPRHLKNENELAGGLANEVLGAVFAAEAPLLERLSFPFGVSLACVAQKP